MESGLWRCGRTEGIAVRQHWRNGWFKADPKFRGGANRIEDITLKHVAILALITAPLAADQNQFPPKGSPEQRAAYERGRARQAQFEQSLFVDAGFQPLETVTAEKRAVKRVLFSDPYMMLPVPGVEIERMSDGSVTLKVIGRSGASAPASLPASAWGQLTTLQGTMFRPKPYVPWDPPNADAPLPPPPPVCHGWIVRFGIADEAGLESGSWAQCGGNKGPESEFASEIARLAVASRPDCKFDVANPFWAFNACFSSPLGD